MRSLSSFAVLAASLLAPRVADARAVFAHYMVGTVSDDHAHQDVDDAIKMGLDAFSLNIGYPQASHVYPALASLFGYVDWLNTQGKNFKLFISMDLWAAGDVKHGDGTNVNAFDYGDLFKEFITRPSYYQGPNGKPFVTTFSDGGMNNDSFLGWRETLSKTGVYFVPDLDHTQGFNTSHPEWWKYWGPVFDGVTAWETAWTYRAGYGGYWPGDTRWDKQVIEGIDGNPGTKAHGKTYMMPMSSIQYKNAYSTNIYREGGLNLVQRMKETLEMANGPDFIQIITWNDGPESHYIGNIWPEQNTDYAPSLYMSDKKGQHTAWQPIIHSFIVAFKAGARSIAHMTLPPGTSSGTPYVGAIWYRQILSSATCQGAQKPDGFETAKDRLTWAVIVDGSATFTVSCGSQPSVTLSPGLNFGEFDLKEGNQRVTLQRNGVLVGTASGGPCAYTSCPDGIYNMNVEVIPFIADAAKDVSCKPASWLGGKFIEMPSTDSYTFKNKSDICGLDLSDEARWEQSGARAFLDYAVTNWPRGNIDKRMEKLALQTGDLNSHCSNVLLNGACQYKETTCELSKPGIEVYYIRKAFFNYHATLQLMYFDKFLASAQAASVVVDQIVEDFGEELLKPRTNDPAGMKDFLKVFGFALSMAESATGNPVLGIVGGAIGFAEDAIEEPDLDDLKKNMAKVVREQIWDGLTKFQKAANASASALFDAGDVSKFTEWSFVPGGKATTDIGRIFDKGRYLSAPEPIDGEIVLRTLRLSVLNMVMKIAGVYVLHGAHTDPNGNQGNKCNFPLSVWDSSNCHSIEYSGAGPAVSSKDTDVSVFTTQLSTEIKAALAKFAEEQKFLPTDILHGSEECQAATGDFDGLPDDSIAPKRGSSDEALCTWSLPLIFASPYTNDFPNSDKSAWYHSPCKVTYNNRDNVKKGIAGVDYLPTHLEGPDAFSADWCFPDGPPKGGWGNGGGGPEED